jgi:hypothetical protein
LTRSRSGSCYLSSGPPTNTWVHWRGSCRRSNRRSGINRRSRINRKRDCGRHVPTNGTRSCTSKP